MIELHCICHLKFFCFLAQKSLLSLPEVVWQLRLRMNLCLHYQYRAILPHWGLRDSFTPHLLLLLSLRSLSRLLRSLLHLFFIMVSIHNRTFNSINLWKQWSDKFNVRHKQRGTTLIYIGLSTAVYYCITWS